MSQLPEVVSEMFFWKNNFKTLNLRKFLSHTNFQTAGISDASSTGYVTNLTTNNGRYTANKSLSEKENLKSSTWRKISVIEFALKAFVYLLKNSSVLWNTDNYASTFVVDSSSSKNNLQKTAKHIFYFCNENSVTLKVMWIPREELSSVDRLKKIIDHDDWRSRKPFFEILNNLCGLLTTDKFEDHKNSKTGRFNSKFYVPSTEGVNAFNFHWSNEMN